MFSRRPGALRRWGGASTPRRSKREARRRLRHLLLGGRGTNMAEELGWRGGGPAEMDLGRRGEGPAEEELGRTGGGRRRSSGSGPAA